MDDFLGITDDVDIHISGEISNRSIGALSKKCRVGLDFGTYILDCRSVGRSNYKYKCTLKGVIKENLGVKKKLYSSWCTLYNHIN